MPISVEPDITLFNIPKQDYKSDEFYHDTFDSKDFEATYCRDFICCGLILNDLHDLLQHYEEHHFDEQEDEFDLQDNYDSCWSIPSSSVPSPFLSSSNLPLLEIEQDSKKDPAAAYFSDLFNKSHRQDEETPTIGKKRSFKHISSLPAIDIVTQTTLKKLAVNGGSIHPLIDKDFLIQASTLLASTYPDQGSKPYKCSIDGCDKAYKNSNGLKYHNQHGHFNKDEDKPYQCTIGECGKKYKNLNGLKYHIDHSHMALLNHTLASFNCFNF